MNGGDDGADAGGSGRRGGDLRRLAGGDGRLDKVRLDGEKQTISRAIFKVKTSH